MTKAFKAVSNLTKAVPSPNASEQLMVWLKQKPRTYGWGAILAYDRQKANKMLKQEHISRFNGESIMLPVTLEVPGGGETKKLYGYEFDAPIMSFENYSDGDISDEPRCVLRMPIIAGYYMTVAAKGIVTSISALDPLDGQVLSMIMDLKTGTVNEKKQVMFNIQDGTDFSVDINDNYLDQIDVGKVFKAYFEEQVPDAKKVWALSQIDTSKNEYLKPSVIKLEVRKREGAAEIADGELIICVGMEGDSAGTSLPSDFEYLTEGDSAVIVLGQKTLLDKVVHSQVLNNYASAETAVEKEGDQFRLRVIKGGREVQSREWFYKDEDVGSSHAASINYQLLPFASTEPENNLTVVVGDGKLISQWVGSNVAVVAAYYPSDWTVSKWEGTITQPWEVMSSVEYQVNSDGSGLVSSDPVNYPGSWDPVITCTNIPGATNALAHVFNDLCPSYKSEYIPSVISGLQDVPYSAIANLPEVNTFVLESILFKNEDTVSLSSCALPNDLVMFGDVGPTATAFEITPMEAIILHGKTQQFSLAPQGASSVTWSVESASGDPQFVGSINPTGLYKAPDLSGYQGSLTRVRVIATYGNYKTYALVSVLKKTITVNPLVTVKIIGEVPGDADKVTLTANSADGKAPAWKLKPTGNEGTLKSTTGFTNVYTPRPYADVDVAYVIDEIVLTDSFGTEHSAIIVVDHGVSVNSAMTEGSSTATTVQLQCKVGKEDLTEFTEFNVLLGGSGTVSETALYTQAQGVVNSFVLINCVTSDFGREVISYILIPLPLSASGSAE